MKRISDPRLRQAHEIVEEAAAMAMSFFGHAASLRTETKGPQDFVSEADKAVETLIRTRLAKTFPGEAICGEEFGGTEAKDYWIIDPIDGTSNFLRGSPLWGVSLGYVRAGVPRLGAVAIPVAGEVYAAAEGQGLFLNGSSFVRPQPGDDVRVVSLGDSLRDDIADAAAFYSGLRQAGWVVEAFHSTSVSMIYAARGIFDGHLQKVTSMWDIAGGAVLCREAGLDVRIGRDAVTGDHWVAAGTSSLLSAAAPLWPTIMMAAPPSAA